AYLFALLVAISVAGAVRGSRWEDAVLYCVYAATLAGITMRIMFARTNARYWATNLNATRSVIVGVDETAGIEACLRLLRGVRAGGWRAGRCGGGGEGSLGDGRRPGPGSPPHPSCCSRRVSLSMPRGHPWRA